MREITRKYLFMGKLELKTALHIGGGKINLRGTDSPVVLTPEQEPFIPGSSFKGAFRSTVEKLVNCIPNLWSCCLFEGDCPTANKEDFNNRRRDNKWDEAELAQVLESELCDTCKLFGSPYSASKIYFLDLYVEDWAGALQIRDGVAIDRDSERAVEGFKYDYEVVPVGSTFNMEVVLENPGDVDLGLTCLGLNEFASGMGYTGGLRSRGLGNCCIIDLKGYELDLTNEKTKAERLRNYLLGKKIQDKMSEIADIEKFMQNKIENLLK